MTSTPSFRQPFFARSSLRLVGWMVASVVGVAVLAYWDESREAAAALDDFGESQGLLAQSVASELAGRLEAMRRDAYRIAVGVAPSQPETYSSWSLHREGEPPPPAEAGGRGLALSIPVAEDRRVDFVVPHETLFAGASRLERPSALVVWFQLPGASNLVSTDGRQVAVQPLVHALDGGPTSIRLSRSEAEQLSLPPRTALAGLARTSAAGLGRFGVAVVASAERERDREARAHGRLLLAVALAAALVLAFGGFALRKQHRELSLASELAIAAVERDRDERLSRLSRAATTMTLASGMAHELSTPLGVIVGRAEQLLARVTDDERLTRSVQTILDQALRIGEVIRGFMNLARGGQLSLQSAEPLAIVRGATSLVEHRFSKRAVLLEANVPDTLPSIRCDRRLLEQALVNLLLNACDACHPGGHVRVVAGLDSSGVCFTVTDDGTGISPENAARLAEPFFTTKPAGAGTGLGLAVTNEIVKTHHGSLSISPATPRGTRAVLQIPFAPGGPDARA